MVHPAAAQGLGKVDPKLARTRLSRFSFFADFWFYPLVSAALVALAISRYPEQWGRAILALAAGLGFWTFVEYLLHRYVLHHLPGVKEHHEDHHNDQKALIGTPTWVSFLFLSALVGAPAAYVAGISLGGCFTAGTMLGYVWYTVTHYGMHHWKSRPGSFFAQLKYRHALHHHFDDMGNFGVTSGFWDHVFRTNVGDHRKNRQPVGSSES